jgi:tetratricopeptide (TPR) repeat protein
MLYVKGEKMDRNRLIEAAVRVILLALVAILYIMYFTGVFRVLPRSLETIILTLDISAAVIAIWFMPSKMAERKLKKGLKYFDKDNDKAAVYLSEYVEAQILTEAERRNGLRILGVAHHKRGDDERAIQCMNKALEGYEKDNDLKVEILGAIGIIYCESGQYQKAIEYFDKTFDIIFSMSKAHIDKNILLQVIAAYIKAGQRDKALSIYDRLLMIRGFKRIKKAEALLGLEEGNSNGNE